MSSNTIDLFLCHSSVDKEWVMQLAEAIEAEDFNGRKLKVFLDAWDIGVGENIVWRLNQGLETARFVAVVMSPEMLTSDWCSLEVSAMLMADPINRQGKIVPILLRDQSLEGNIRINIPPVLKALNYLDFRNKKDFLKEFDRLAAKVKGIPATRSVNRKGMSSSTAKVGIEAVQTPLANDRHSPDEIPDILVSNLLAVTMPEYVWCAPTHLQSKHDLHEFYRYPAFIVRENKIYTFADLSDKKNPFADYLKQKGKYEKIKLRSWFADEAKWRWCVEILNDALRGYLYHQGVNFHSKSKRYYFRPKNNNSVSLRWGAGDKRCVVKKPKDGGGGSWIHQAAHLKFEKISDQIYLSIDPSYMFTLDGHTTLSKESATPLAAMWGGRERNGAIIRHMLMWSDTITMGLARGEIDCHGQVIEIERLPLTATTNVGIAGDKAAIRALLQFTDGEKNLSPDDELIYGFIEEELEEAAQAGPLAKEREVVS